jgi:hypothetical protein
MKKLNNWLKKYWFFHENHHLKNENHNFFKISEITKSEDYLILICLKNQN